MAGPTQETTLAIPLSNIYILYPIWHHAVEEIPRSGRDRLFDGAIL